MRVPICIPARAALNPPPLPRLASTITETGSAALIPLTAPPLAGVLAIGSRDPDRFHEGKSVDFLQRLAEVVSAKLQSASSPGI